MPTEINYVGDIAPGRIDWTLKVRVIHLWHVFNPKNNDELNQIDMLLLDEKCGKIQATIKKHLLTRHAGYIEEGSTYIFHKFLVAQNDPKYRKTEHKYKLFFMGMTQVCNTSAESIPLNRFDFADFKKIQTEMKPDVYCDVIGHIVEKDILKDIEKNGRRMLLLDIVMEDLKQNRLTVTMWGEHAERVNTYLANTGESGVVPAIFQLVRLNKYKGVMAVSTTFFGTKIILDDETLPEIRCYKKRMAGYSGSIIQPVTQMVIPTSLTLAEELLQTRRMTIADLLEASDPGFGVVLARVIEIELDQGWLYESCNSCLRRVTQVGNKFSCEHCGTMVAATPRFKLQLQVIDVTGSTTFTLFNTIVAMYLGRSSADLIRSIKEQLDCSPTGLDEFEAFIGKDFLFKVDVSEGNILKGWQAFTVKKITDDSSIIKQFKIKHQIEMSSEEEDAVYAKEVNQIGSSQAGLDDINLNETQSVEEPIADNTPSAVVDMSSTQGSPSNIVSSNDTQFSPTTVLNLNYFEEMANAGIELSDSEITPTTNVNGGSSDAYEVTPRNNSNGKRGASAIDPIEFHDLDSVSPSAGKVSKTSPDLASIDLSTIDFNSPPTTKIPPVVVKIEKSG